MSYSLITGGLGLIGTFLAKELLNKKKARKVICLDNFGRYSSSTYENFKYYRNKRLEYLGKNIIIERGDAKYQSVIQKILMKYKPKYIFHLAALPLAKLDNLNSEEALEGSVLSTTNIINSIVNLNRVNNYKPKKFIYASSSMVYGDFKKSKIDENHATNPKEIYGTMKLAGEAVTKGMCEFYKINYNIIRPSAVYGPSDMNRRVSQIFIEKALMGKTINIQGRDEALDFTFVKDTANGFVLSAINPRINNQIFNVTYGKAQSLLKFAQTLRKFIQGLNLKFRLVTNLDQERELYQFLRLKNF